MKPGFSWSCYIADMSVGLAIKTSAWWIGKLAGFVRWKRDFLSAAGFLGVPGSSIHPRSAGAQMRWAWFWCVLRWHLLSVWVWFFFPSHPQWCSPRSCDLFVRASCVLCFVPCDIGVAAASKWHCAIHRLRGAGHISCVLTPDFCGSCVQNRHN